MFETKKRPKDLLSSEKEWFIIVENRQEGPFSLLDLKRNPRFTPDTLVWKKGFKEWTAARDVSEIAEVFKDEIPSKALHAPHEGKPLDSDIGQENQATLTLQQDPYPLILWILIAVLIIIYTYLQFFDK